MTQHLITREIGIDAGHRVTFHGSKCRNIHGHRYTIQATCIGPLVEEGEQQGMVLDFGFLKEEMMNEIDGPCDHGFIMWVDDDLMRKMFEPRLDDFEQTLVANSLFHLMGHAYVDCLERWWTVVEKAVTINGHFATQGRGGNKLYVVPFVPTAENLAKHWFERLAVRVRVRTGGKASLHKIKVWETPNCSAEYPAT